MSKYKKRYSQKDKLEIINYFNQHGGARTKRRYDVSVTSIYKWIDLFEEHGPEGLENIPTRTKEDPELARLRRENKALKTILADKELELKIKNDLLKKSR